MGDLLLVSAVCSVSESRHSASAKELVADKELMIKMFGKDKVTDRTAENSS